MLSTTHVQNVRGVPGCPDRTRRVGGGSDCPVRRVDRDADPDRFPRIAGAADLLTQPDERARRDFAIRVLLLGIEAGSS